MQTSPTFVEASNYEEPTFESHINLTISVFFDGTMNNRSNVQSRQNANNLQEGQVYYEGEGSYENDFSNVSRLEEKYLPQETETKKEFSVYINGIGTRDNEEDSTVLGGGLDIGETGIVNKVKIACEEVANKASDLGYKRIDYLVINAFGFSRGAAAARHFLHEVMENSEKNVKDYVFKNYGYTTVSVPVFYNSKHGWLGDYFLEKGIKVRNFRVDFVGLFETVASHGIFHFNDTRNLGLDSIRKARHVFQLVAADEHRVNFRLTNIDSATGKKGLEKTIPGVHSDVGGCYVHGAKEKVLLDYSVSFLGLLGLYSEKKYLINQGWYRDEEIEVHKLSRRLIGQRSGLSNQYSFIPLHIMAKHSLNNNVKFKSGVLKSEYKIPNALVKINERLNNYVFKNGSPLLFETDMQVIKDLRNKYLHFSANYKGIGMNPERKFFSGKRERIIQDG